MRVIWTDDDKDSLRRNWKRPNWIQVIIEETGLSERQIKNKAQSMGYKRRRAKVHNKLPKETFKDPEPPPECIRHHKCPHGGLLNGERNPITQSYDYFCHHGWRYPLP